ncbi:MAG: FIST C-terminal domain-containing protein [Oscillospiraceae bacterium]|nr:FIST C-terminal domain-containing protein [Oscillospiraceae bacterium]
MKSYVITIDEVDDVTEAVACLQKELSHHGLPQNLRKNSIGIVTAHASSVYSGVCKAICDALPFETAGIAVDSQNANGEIGIYLITIMILTCDECHFVASRTKNIKNIMNSAPLIEECFLKLKSKLSALPDAPESKLCLMYAPVCAERYPGEYLEAISNIDTEIPVFGSVSVDVERLTSESEKGVITIHNGEFFSDSVVMLLLAGESVSPKFHITSFNKNAIIMQNIGRITKCEQNLLYEINNKPVIDFLYEIGFLNAETKSKIRDSYSGYKLDTGSLTSSFILNYGSEINISRSYSEFTANGALVCLGYIQEGASISIAVSSPDSITETACELLDKIQCSTNDEQDSTVLMYSCLGRRLGLLNKPTAEFELIRDKLSKSSMNYVVSHVGGEICPVKLGQNWLNCEHNQTLIVCVL